MNHRDRIAWLLVALVCAVGCSKRTTPGAEPVASAATPAAPDTPAHQAAPAASAFNEPNYDVSVRPTGPYKAGQPGAVEIVLQAKPPFHCNDKYPYKLKLDDAPGVTFPDKLVGKDAVKVEHMQATMTVPFTPATAGKKTIAGRYLFSVCSADKCLVDKRDVKLDIDVM